MKGKYVHMHITYTNFILDLYIAANAALLQYYFVNFDKRYK